MNLGITLVSHVPEIAEGLPQLLNQVAKDVPITKAGGTNDNDIGTSMEKIMQAFADNQADEILAFYDLGSAKMNLEMAIEMSDKKVHLYDTAFLEMAKKSSSTDNVGELLDAALAGIQKRGGAEPGDKTMVDVWYKLVPDIKDGSLSEDKIKDAVEATKDMIAKKGRASYLGERSKGHIDPGSESSGYLFETLLETEGLL